MRVLVTRPIEDAVATAQRLRELGHEPLIAPLLEIRFRDGPELSLDNVQGVVATSANGVRALARRTKRRDLPVFAVGAQTASVARASGFADVKHSVGDSVALADAIAGWTKPQSGALLHAAGNEAGSKLRARLAAQGFELRVEILYDVVAAAQLHGDAREALRTETLDAVLLYSPRSAENFVRCVEAAGLSAGCHRLIAACISRAAADKLGPLPVGEIRIAVVPAENELLGLLTC
jgi:uroporphyrinogen-III synthase